MELTSMNLPQDFKILAESQNYILGHVFEYGSIIDKRTGTGTYIGDSYGDPTFGIIDQKEKWALLFGHDTYMWTPSGIKYLNDEMFVHEEVFESPYDAKQINDFEVEILDDPWGQNPGIYNFNIMTSKVIKIRSFKQLTIPYDKYNRTKLLW